MVFCSRILHFFAYHSFFIMFMSILAGIMSLVYFMAKKKAFVLLLLLLPIWGVVNFVKGSDINNGYVDKHGAPGTGVVTQMAPTGELVHHLQELRYSAVLKTEDGRTFDYDFTNNGIMYYPHLDAVVPPSVGEVFSIKYIPGDEGNFIICTTDSSSEYVQRIHCLEILTRLASARAKYQLDSSNDLFKKEYDAAITGLMVAPCDTSLKATYHSLQRRLEK